MPQLPLSYTLLQQIQERLRLIKGGNDYFFNVPNERVYVGKVLDEKSDTFPAISVGEDPDTVDGVQLHTAVKLQRDYSVTFTIKPTAAERADPLLAAHKLRADLLHCLFPNDWLRAERAGRLLKYAGSAFLVPEPGQGLLAARIDFSVTWVEELTGPTRPQ